MGRGARPRVFVHAGSRPAAARSRAPRFCRGRICRRRAEPAGRGARPVRLCDAGAVEDRRQCRVLQRHLSPRRDHAAEMRGDDVWPARRRAVLSLPWAVDGDRRPSAWRPHPARGECCRRTVCGRRLRDRRRHVHGRAGYARPISNCSGRSRGRRPMPRATSRAFALRLRPNQDFAAALENFCRQRGIFRARLHGGVGSTIGAHFTDGRNVVPFATELAIRSGDRSRRAPTASWKRHSMSRWWIISAASPKAV